MVHELLCVVHRRRVDRRISGTYNQTVIGTQVGAYRVLQQIGEGGMGAVYLAEHAMLGRRAALKVLHASFSARPEIVTRFFNEAKAATAIADPGIVQIFDFGHADDGSAYIVMELLQGETLDKRTRKLGVVPVQDALRILKQVSSSLAAAHDRGIVHRDLKPENIFLVPDPEVVGGERAKILDFGIAKLTGDPSIKTQTSAMMGTPMFMSPEQCRGAGQVDHRSDIYALGCVLFATLTGRPPFDAEGIGDIIAMHLRERAPAPSSFVPGLSPDVDRLVARCLEKDPAARFANARELAAALDALRGPISAVGASVPTPSPMSSERPVVTPPRTTLATAATSSSVVAPPARRGGKIVGIVTGVVVVAGAGIAIATMSGRDTPETPSAPMAAAPSAPPAPLPAPPPADAAVATLGPDAAASPSELLVPAMTTVVQGFVAWAHTNTGAPCPTLEALGVPGVDPWGRPLVITCTDQPANQIIGVISLGADGVRGTDDDFASWDIDRGLASTVRGPRWKETATAAKPTTNKKPGTPSRPVRPPATVTTPATTPPPTPSPSTTPPKVQYDENGLPIQR